MKNVRVIACNHLSRLIGKPTICICENKDADQLHGNREADQRLCFRYPDSTIPLLLKSEISSFKLFSVLVQPGFCRTCSETTLLVFPQGGSFINSCSLTYCLYWKGENQRTNGPVNAHLRSASYTNKHI